MTPSPETLAPAGPCARARVEGHELRSLSAGWQAARVAADEPAGVEDLDALAWIPARVPGTAAAALADAGLWRAGQPYDFDAEDWWFRTSFDAEPVEPGEELVLHLDGIATVAEVYLNGTLVLESDSMFAPQSLDIGGGLLSANELAIRCRALAPLLEVRRRPRARWRTRLVSDGNLRFFRTMLLGRAPGFAPGPATVGPWRPVRIERRRRLAVERLVVRARLDGEDGVVSVSARLRPLNGLQILSAELELQGPSGTHRAALSTSLDSCDSDSGDGDGDGDGDRDRAGSGGLTVAGELVIPRVARWWPHTHGAPHLHEVRLLVSGAGEGSALGIEAGRVGFRELEFGAGPDADVERDGIDLRVNGVPVFARGAVWTPIDAVGMAPPETELRRTLERVREAGMNMLRLPGTGAYESESFHDLCDELGILLWQDFMFANLDYPVGEPDFLAVVQRECARVLDALGGRPSLTVLCGNSEIEQQAAMLGQDPAVARGEWFGELLPALVSRSDVDALYVPSAPCGGELPFRPDRGIANYYGVGGYRRPLEDARRANVRFAAECLAFSNVPDQAAIDALGQPPPAVHEPAWKAGVPRDNGAAWDFEDVRDHYLELLYGVDAAELRRVDQERYLELSRAVTGEVMAEVLGEWRRSGSSCHGALVLWLSDLLPGAGWGLLDHRGEPKAAYHQLRRALAPVALWTVDEGLGGIVAHVANDSPEPLRAQLRVALYRDLERPVGEGQRAIELDPHSQGEWNVETLIGHFVDAAWAYRFGPPAQDAIVVSLAAREDTADAGRPLGVAVRFPAGRTLDRDPPERLGLTARVRTVGDGEVQLSIASRRLVYGLRVQLPGYRPDDDWITLEPGVERVLTLTPTGPDSSLQETTLSALNMSGRVTVVPEDGER